MSSESGFRPRFLVVIPTYNETEALPVFLAELLPQLTEETLVIISDDSPELIHELTRSAIEPLRHKFKTQIEFNRSLIKMGRGAAVSRVFRSCFNQYPSLNYFLECDADGSHQATEVITILNSPIESDLIIGSRYLPGSEISGWPISRRIYSRILNVIIPRVLGVPVNDITNGLRRYSRNSVSFLASCNLKEKGFIALSEQAYLLSKQKFSFLEIPIHFIDRTHGTSTVGLREIAASLSGLGRLIYIKNRNRH